MSGTITNMVRCAFANSLLTSMDMWNPFVLILKETRPDLCILRYDSRGRHHIPKPEATSLGTLAADLHAVLNALRIPRLHSLIGVSIGGAMALQAAITYPDMVGRVIVCDTNCASPQNGAQVWKDRIALSEENHNMGIQMLATQTVARWFHASSMKNEALVSWMTEMVAANNVEGFKYSCTALWDYDITDQLGLIQGPALLVAGEDDANGAVPRAMSSFKNKVSDKGVELKIMPETGHLPMCERPQVFWEALERFLA